MLDGENITVREPEAPRDEELAALQEMWGDGAVVEDQARVVRAVVGAAARVEPGAAVYDSVVGDRAVVGAHCELRQGLRIWPDVVLPPHGVRFSADVMMGIPSIVVGLFAYAIIVRPMHSFSTLSGAFALAIIMIPLVTVIGLELGSVIAFAVVTETIFAWPGMGKLVIDSIFQLDRPGVGAYLLVVVFMFIVINLVVDLMYSSLDPRVRLADIRE